MIVGKSLAIKNILRLIEIASRCDYPVLILGETGTGKELIARQIHSKSPRCKSKFVALNCASLAETLLTSELFGYTRGSFSGALQDTDGLFQIADGGTLFLDEIECMSSRMQQVLLRVCESGEVRRIGASNPAIVNTRVIASSNEDLESLMKNSNFRRDLYHRLSVIKIDAPPLRTRREDIPLLVDHFLKIIAMETNTLVKQVDEQCLEVLIQYDWPGNVRELLNTLRSACVMTGSNCLEPLNFHLPGRRTSASIGGLAGGNGLSHAANDIDVSGANPHHILSIDEYIKDVIKQYGPGMQVKEIARRLGVSRKTIWQWRKKMVG